MQEKYGIVSNDGHINSLYVLWAKEQQMYSGVEYVLKVSGILF